MNLPPLIDGRPEAWTEEALCAQFDPDAWYPRAGSNAREVKKVCDRCPVRLQCLNYALENDDRHGVWGGVSEGDRRKMSRDRRAIA